MKESEKRPDADSEKGLGSEEERGSAEGGATGPAEEHGSAEGHPAGSAEVQASDVISEAEAPAERVAKRRPGRRRGYFPTVAVSAAVVLFALAVFMAGFGAHYLLDDDVDLKPIEDQLAVLNQRTDQIQQRLSGVGGGDGGDGGGGDGGGETFPEAALSEASNDDPTTAQVITLASIKYLFL